MTQQYVLWKPNTQLAFGLQLVAVFKYEDDAIQVQKEYGGLFTMLPYYDDWQEFLIDERTERLKKSALTKLTKEEREVLGV